MAYNLGSTNFRQLGIGYDGTVPGIGGCPFDMNQIQQNYVNGTITPTKIIQFNAGALTTEVSMQLTPLDDYKGEQVLDVLACSGFYESSTSSLRIPNLHKPGGARASDVWVAIPDNIVVPKLVQKLHQGALDRITISTLDFLDTGQGEDKPKIVQVHDYQTCFVKFVDPVSYGNLAVFSFSFSHVRIVQTDYKQLNDQGGSHGQGGRFVYEFDYNAALGKIGS